MENQINTSPSPSPVLDEGKLIQYKEQLRMEQNLPLAFLAGSGAAIISGLLWAVITVATEYQIGYMAIAVGLLVGFSVKFAGKGMDQIFGILGAVLALFGCLLGNFFSVIGFIANNEGLGYFETLASLDFSLIPDIMISTFSPMDLLFYGLAIYEGYKFSFRQITEEELIANTSKTTL